LATRKKTKLELTWHTVCGQWELEQLVSEGQIKPLKITDQRHWVWLKMQFPNTEFYVGSWGQEILHFRTNNEFIGAVCVVHTTWPRYKLIAEWFLEQLSRSKNPTRS